MYLKLKDAAKRYAMSQQFLHQVADKMGDSGRYPNSAVIRTPGATLFLDTALHDFLVNMTAIKHGLKIEPFDPTAMQKELKELDI